MYMYIERERNRIQKAICKNEKRFQSAICERTRIRSTEPHTCHLQTDLEELLKLLMMCITFNLFGSRSGVLFGSSIDFLAQEPDLIIFASKLTDLQGKSDMPM